MGNLDTDARGLLDNRKIMLVDDSAALRGALRAILSSLGAGRLTEAGDAGEAIAALSCESVDLLITDWKMEPLDGLALVRAVREGQCAVSSDVPILMLTAYCDARYEAEAMRAGVTAFIEKPFTPRSLLGGLSAVLATKTRTGEAPVQPDLAAHA
ncbi:MAG: response regulator [Maricaulis sp.]|nr:response regulator [Maricaulis sp.]HAQ34592.1 response regulator [Alphaproteobacteria bacterium]